MTNKKNILIVVAARGGSKGVKNKNIRVLIDRPLMAYTIQQAVKWGKATNIICSTDSKKIAEIAKKYGAEVPFMRPKHLAGDKVAKIRVLRHALVICEKIYNKMYDIIIDLDVSAPIRKIFDLDSCLKLFNKKKANALFSVVKSRKNPYFNMVEKKKDGKIGRCKTPEKQIFARQDTPPVYDMNASIYFYQRDYLLDRKNTTPLSNDCIIYVMDDISAFDIDSELDFKFIEFLMRKGIWKNEV